MIKNYIKIAWRTLLKHRLNTSINIGGLALGLATAVLLILWIYNEYTYDSYHKNVDNVYRVTSHIKVNKDETWHWAATPLLLAHKLSDNFSEVEASTKLYVPWADVNVKVNHQPRAIDKMLYVDRNWFDIFDYEVTNGSLSEFKIDKNNVAITESKAKELFGKEDPINKIIQLDSISLVVKAILGNYPPNTIFKFDVYAQNASRLANPETYEEEKNWNDFNYQTYVVCNENTDIGNLSNKATALFREIREDKEANNELKFQPLTAIHYDNSIEIGEMSPPVDKKVLWVFTGIAFLILLTACINYVNLTTANISLRNKEVSIKKFMGVSKAGLFNQFFIESTLTSLFAMVLAIGLIYLGLPILESVVDTKFNIANNPLVWMILGAAVVLSILFNGVYPSILLSNLKPLALSKGESVLGTKNATFRKVLVVFQFSFTIVILICTTLIFRQLEFMQENDVGYEKAQVFSFSLPWYLDETGEKTEAIHAQLKQESQIVDITKSSGTIVNFNSIHSGSLDWDGREEDWNPTVSPMSVDNNYQSFYDLKLTSGRWFSAGNTADDNHVILNETAVNEFKLKEPVVGQKFTYQKRTGQVIGVVQDFHFKSPKEKITPLLFFRKSDWQSTISVKADPRNISGAIAAAERCWTTLVPNAPFKYAFLDDSYAKLHKSESNQLQLFYTFGGIVLLISCFGLFGLATFAAEVRIKEIGIRKVLGANVLEIINLLSRDFLVLILIAAVVATPLAWWFMQKWLRDFAYHIDIGWWAFIIPLMLVTTFTLVTVSYQSIRTALMNPIKSLKSD
ncbi:MAG: putative ABC transport system permease protein [Arcticibacterium sp.]|jgi:putative ABC transport system permease protein